MDNLVYIIRHDRNRGLLAVVSLTTPCHSGVSAPRIHLLLSALLLREERCER
jgi:hypothetical protein